jgi:hypothetical protein
VHASGREQPITVQTRPVDHAEPATIAPTSI